MTHEMTTKDQPDDVEVARRAQARRLREEPSTTSWSTSCWPPVASVVSR
ncbi:hypothetical protein [Georgenia yuyongxinii]